MKIVILPVGSLQTNCYLIYDENSKEALVIDPGDEGLAIAQEIERLGLKVRQIVNTHGHGDHIGANGYLKEKTKAPLAIHEKDAPMLTNAALNFSIYMGGKIDRPAPDRLLQEGDEVEAGKVRLKVLHTPGHTRGGICLVSESEKVCFSGDTLFADSIGRTDLSGGSYQEIISSITGKLMVLDDDVKVYPGHGPATSIGEERLANPYLKHGYE